MASDAVKQTLERPSSVVDIKLMVQEASNGLKSLLKVDSKENSLKSFLEKRLNYKHCIMHVLLLSEDR